MQGNIDLHMHSTMSDGTDSPADLVRHVLESGIRTFALTDHDTIRGAMEVQRILDADQNLGMDVPEFFRGIEFSCVSEGDAPFKCHLLGYQYDPEDEKFRAALDLDHGLRMAKTRSRLEYLEEKGIRFTKEELDYLHSLESPGKPHLRDLILRHGYAKSAQEAMDMIRTKVRMETRIPVRMAISGILSSGGVPVWAHPLGGEGEKHLSKEEFERRLRYLVGREAADGGSEADKASGAEAAERAAGEKLPAIMGIECWYSRYCEEEVNFLLEEAKKFGLLVSGGSDYHGTVKNIRPGEMNTFGKPVFSEQLTVAEELRKRS